jgi:hypothetical protein
MDATVARAGRDAVTLFEVGPMRAWRYTSKPHVGRCKVDGESLRLRVRVEYGRAATVPDVLHVERWLAGACRTPTTVEDVAAAAHAVFGGVVTAVGETATHGRIRVCVDGR